MTRTGGQADKSHDTCANTALVRDQASGGKVFDQRPSLRVIRNGTRHDKDADRLSVRSRTRLCFPLSLPFARPIARLSPLVPATCACAFT